jgi:hypothetical protein
MPAEDRLDVLSCLYERLGNDIVFLGGSGSQRVRNATPGGRGFLVKSYWLVPPTPSDAGRSAVSLDRCNQIEGHDLWAIRGTHGSMVLNRDGEWEDEPIPSYRDEAFMARCRFATQLDAVTAWVWSQS